MENLPPRFAPDNSDAARAARKRTLSWGGAVVSEQAHRHVVSAPEGQNDKVVYLPEFTLGPFNNVVQVDFRPPEPPDVAA